MSLAERMATISSSACRSSGPRVEAYRPATFASTRFPSQLATRQYLFYPSIDPLSDKNKELYDAFVQKVCDYFGIGPANQRDRPNAFVAAGYGFSPPPLGGGATYDSHFVGYQIDP